MAGVLTLRGMAVLLALQAVGEVMARGWHWPVPGPVVGMGLLMLALAWPPVRAPVQAAANGLLAHLSLLFVPVGVGVMTHLPVLSQHGMAIATTLLVSTWLGLGVAAGVMKRLTRAAP